MIQLGFRLIPSPYIYHIGPQIVSDAMMEVDTLRSRTPFISLARFAGRENEKIRDDEFRTKEEMWE